MQESDCDTSDLPPKLLLKGLDSLYVSFYLNRPEVNWEELGYQKERLREEADVQFLGLQLAGEDWSLQPYGHYPYKVILSNETFELRLAEYMQPNCYLVVRSEALWTYGLDQLEERINRLGNELSALGRCEAETVSRADWAFDFQLSQVDFQETDFLTRAAKSAKRNED